MADVNKTRITTAASTVVKAKPGQLYGIVVGKWIAAGTVEVFDAATVTGTAVLMLTAPAVLLDDKTVLLFPHPINMLVGISVRTVEANDLTVLYN